MQSFLNFIKSLFTEKQPELSFPLGALKNPVDMRDIHLAAFQAPTSLPIFYKSNIFVLGTENQLALGTCVWQAITKLVEYYNYQRTGNVVKLSARSGYARSKQLDGIPLLQGTYPRIAAKIILEEGVATDDCVVDDSTLSHNQYVNVAFTEEVKANMKKNTLPGYAFSAINFNAVCQAIFTNGCVVGTLAVDANWYQGIIKRVLQPLGYHYTLWHGFDTEGIYAKNSWGPGWIGTALGKVPGEGEFYFKWYDYEGQIFDVIAFTNIPKEIIDVVKNMNFHFIRNMKLGDRSYDVLELQKRLEKEGYWPLNVPKTDYYGAVTAQAVYKYQIANKVASRAQIDILGGRQVGPATLLALNGGSKKTLEEAIIQVESQGNIYAVGDQHLVDMAYGPMQIRQPACTDVNNNFGTNYQAKDMLGNLEKSLDVFKKYQEIYNPNGSDEEKARTWNGGAGWRRKPVLTDGYWAKVSALLK